MFFSSAIRCAREGAAGDQHAAVSEHLRGGRPHQPPAIVMTLHLLMLNPFLFSSDSTLQLSHFFLFNSVLFHVFHVYIISFVIVSNQEQCFGRSVVARDPYGIFTYCVFQAVYQASFFSDIVCR